MCHLVICASHLEAKHRLQVLSLEQHPTLQPVTQVRRIGHGRLVDDLVHTSGKDEAEVLQKAVRWRRIFLQNKWGPCLARERERLGFGQYIWIAIGQKKGLWNL